MQIALQVHLSSLDEPSSHNASSGHDLGMEAAAQCNPEHKKSATFSLVQTRKFCPHNFSMCCTSAAGLFRLLRGHLLIHPGPPSPLLLLLLLFFGVFGLFPVPATSHPLPAGSSKVALPSWDGLMGFSAKQVHEAMGTPAHLLPQIPDPASIGETNLMIIQSLDRKMDAAEVEKRHHALLEEWQARFQGQVSFEAFSDWSAPIYNAYLTSLDLHKSGHFADFAYHRGVLLGLRVVHIISSSEGSRRNRFRLNHLSALDPYETRFYTGLVEPPDWRANARVLEPLDPEETRRVLSSLPTSYNMQDSGLMPPIYNQGNLILVLGGPQRCLF